MSVTVSKWKVYLEAAMQELGLLIYKKCGYLFYNLTPLSAFIGVMGLTSKNEPACSTSRALESGLFLQ